MGLRRTPRVAGTTALATLAVLTLGAPSAFADAAPAPHVVDSADAPTSTDAPTTASTGSTTAPGSTAMPVAAATPGVAIRTVIPLPRVFVSRVCGARDDILVVDPAWLAQWGDKVEIFPASLTFQGGTDAELAKPAGMIKAQYRSQYRWVGSKGTEWASWMLYPGTVKPVVDRNVPCPISVEAPQLSRSVVCGAANDAVAFADQVSADQWRITDRTWSGPTLTVSLHVKRGYVGPEGAVELEQDFVDSGECPTS